MNTIKLKINVKGKKKKQNLAFEILNMGPNKILNQWAKKRFSYYIQKWKPAKCTNTTKNQQKLGFQCKTNSKKTKRALIIYQLLAPFNKISSGQRKIPETYIHDSWMLYIFFQKRLLIRSKTDNSCASSKYSYNNYKKYIGTYLQWTKMPYLKSLNYYWNKCFLISFCFKEIEVTRFYYIAA